ncbi:hypothetical protein ZWY2020_040911 [Hordeum vulgare]|nr:hypothetical protein ZWY2020_040911 [Hordeum vulgare]
MGLHGGGCHQAIGCPTVDSEPPARASPRSPPPSTKTPPAPRTTGRPLHQVQFPSSPSPIPAWAAGSSSGPIYTQAPEHPAPSLPFERSSTFGPEFPDRHLTRPPTSAAPGHGGPTSPRFAKLNFTTYDGAEDPLNWLNQCEQFFRGQRTLASDRTWLASYHLRGTAQTWYYALEQDEGGMPPWDRFRELCLLRFGPPHPWQPSADYRLPKRSMNTPIDSKPWHASRQAYPDFNASR